eukprot:CAMPEP_0117661974 /NCGR_PEP_ID=MMETSP0804-20121206/7816_1 /TAXON_ID=1074897 /ORGANISM="Tetraselmis astigmatica, Strain CCMP880" /LENGTH=122 /DNA_ID=CAMNT_0005468863 /DNA_START=207 /DNA_END=575 /DNA_ORIENTATION=-
MEEAEAVAKVTLPLHNLFPLQDKLPLLVLLALFEGFIIFPADELQASGAVDVADNVQAGGHQALLPLPAANIHHSVEKVRFPVAGMELLGDELRSIGEVGAAAPARVEVAKELLQEESAHAY